MANIHTVFEAVLENGITGEKKVKIGVVDKNEYETIRTRLVKFWTDRKEVFIAIGDETFTDYSLCGDWEADTCTAYYYLGKPRRRAAKHYAFEIVDSIVDAIPAPTLPTDSTAIALTQQQPANESTPIPPEIIELLTSIAAK